MKAIPDGVAPGVFGAARAFEPGGPPGWVAHEPLSLVGGKDTKSLALARSDCDALVGCICVEREPAPVLMEPLQLCSVSLVGAVVR